MTGFGARAVLAALALSAGLAMAQAEPGVRVEDPPSPAELARKAREERIARFRAIARRRPSSAACRPRWPMP